ncbi:MAG: hypothetical protein OXL34_09515 [Gemmatimonadota bacterium]|nr:hypothetical protein [Gemmatimonadota bacterium]
MESGTSAIGLHTLSSAGCGLVFLATACSPDAPPEPIEPVVIDLPAPNATLTERQFSKIRAPVRELEDGRLLMADLIENALYVVDFGSGEVREIGSVGEGPTEYQRAGHLFALGGDSTLFTDVTTRRWLVLAGDSVVNILRPAEPILLRLYRDAEELLGADASGRVLGVEGFAYRPEVAVGISNKNADSLRFLISTGNALDQGSGEGVSELETVTEMGGRGRLGFKINRVEMVFQGREVYTNARTPSPLASEAQAWLFKDGWIAVADPDPYRVDWRRPDGRWIRGDSLPVALVPVDRRERCFAASPSESGECDLDRYPGWPEHVPAFQMDTEAWRRIAPNGIALRPGPTGMLLVNRTRSADHPENRFDVVDRTGALRGTIVVGANQTIVGAGRSSLYVTQKDDMDLLTLSRHPWPSELSARD